MHSIKNIKVLSVFSLVMINVIAVDSLRTLPISAMLGLSLISYYLLAACVFFIPIGLIAAELATVYPNTGGIYVWVREAFGPRIGFITIWLQWIYNVVWYPTIMTFIATIIAYLFDNHLAHNKLYLLSLSLSLFWLFTILNCFGMRISKIVSTFGAIMGTIFPMLGIIILGILWYIHDQPLAISFSWHTLLPQFDTIGNVSLFSAVLFGLIGLEMSATHAESVHNPQRDYPRAILFSTIIIFATLVLSSLAIVLVVPNQQLSLVSGLVDAYMMFFNALHMPWLLAPLVLLIILGALSGVSAWILGPAKGLLVSARDGSLPAFFAKVNRHHAPVNLLLTQGVIFSILSSVFILLDSINAAYWMLSALSAQMALLVYIFMFAAAIKLRYSQPMRYTSANCNSYRIPGGNRMMWIIAGSGIICCFATIIIGFFPPTQIPIDNVIFFETFISVGLLLAIALPWFLTGTCSK